MANWLLRLKALFMGCGCMVVFWVIGAVLLGTVLSQFDTPPVVRAYLFGPVVLWVLFAWALFRGGSSKPGTTGAHGTAAFAHDDHLSARGLIGDEGLICGRVPSSGSLVRFNEPGHLLTVAPTRTGKGIGAVIPNALTHPGSLVVIDPKGENARVAARARRELGQAVHVLDPFGVSGELPACFNPLDFIRIGTEDAPEDADLVAEMLAQTDGTKSASSSHFEESARMLLRGVILYVAETADAADRHLGEVRRLLTLPPEPFEELLQEISQSTVAYGSPARAANTLLAMADRERSGVVSTVRRHTDWLESPRFVRTLGRSDFALEDLKDGSTTVFLVLPPSKLKRYRAFNRLFVGLSLSTLQRDAYTKPKGRVLYLLDEIAQLGHLSPLESAVGVAAGYGITLWQFWQDMGQIRAIYKDRWESFVSNSAVMQVFGVSDQRTAQYVSDLLGQTTVATLNHSEGVNASGLGVSHSGGDSLSETGRALMTADEVRRLDGDSLLLFVRECPPLKLQKVRYYQDSEFSGLFDENPMHK